MFIDSHAHLDMEQFDADREQTIARALDGGVEDGTPVPYLDAVPPSVVCFPFGTGGTGTGPVGPQPGGTTAFK